MSLGRVQRRHHCRVHVTCAAIAIFGSSPASAAETIATLASLPLDLRAPRVTDVLSEEKIAEVLARTRDPDNVEEVEVQRDRLRDVFGESRIPPGFRSLVWAGLNPKGLWRLFDPQGIDERKVDTDATNSFRPAPTGPAMAGQPRPYDR